LIELYVCKKNKVLLYTTDILQYSYLALKILDIVIDHVVTLHFVSQFRSIGSMLSQRHSLPDTGPWVEYGQRTNRFFDNKIQRITGGI